MLKCWTDAKDDWAATIYDTKMTSSLVLLLDEAQRQKGTNYKQ